MNVEKNGISRKQELQKWTIIVLSALMVCLVLGLCNAPKSLYVQPVTEALGISRSTAAVWMRARP